MASTSRASHKGEKFAEIFILLEDITDSDVTIVSSEEDEDSNDTTVTKIDNCLTIRKQMKMEALVLAALKLLIRNGLTPYISRTQKNTKIYQVLNILYQLAADRCVHLSQTYRQEEKCAHRNSIPSTIPYLTKNIRQ
jgi:hypothetical protein